MLRTSRRIVALLLLIGGSSLGCGTANATPTSYPDYGSIIDLVGTSILGSGSSYTAGTTVQVTGNTRLSLWAKIVLSGGTGLTAGINMQFTCGYIATTDVIMPVTWSDQASPTVQQTTTLTGTAGSTVWHLVQSGAITGAKAGCAVQARSANASAGSAGDEFQVYAYGL